MPRAVAGAADIARTRALMEHLVRAFEEFCNNVSGVEVPYIDAFMGFHNAHKVIVLDLAARQGLTGSARRLFLRMARDTWDEAIDAEIRKAADA